MVRRSANSNNPQGRFARVFDTPDGQLLITLESDKVLHTHMLLRMRDVTGTDRYFRYLVEGTEVDTIAFFENLNDEQAARMASIVITSGHGLKPVG